MQLITNKKVKDAQLLQLLSLDKNFGGAAGGGRCVINTKTDFNAKVMSLLACRFTVEVSSDACL